MAVLPGPAPGAVQRLDGDLSGGDSNPVFGAGERDIQPLHALVMSREAAKPGSRLKSNGRGKGYQLREESENPA